MKQTTTLTYRIFNYIYVTTVLKKTKDIKFIKERGCAIDLWGSRSLCSASDIILLLLLIGLITKFYSYYMLFATFSIYIT